VNEQGIRFRIGVFVLTAMILLAVLIILFGRFPNFLKGTSKRYYVVFAYAPGVAINTPVRRSGVRIGQVEKVELDDASGKVRVTILIDPPHVLYDDDRPRLVRGALSGDTSIDFEPPASTGNGTPAPEGRSEKPPDIQRISFLLAQQQPQGNPPPERKPAPPGTVFQGASQSDVSSLISELNKLAPPAREAFIEMQKTLERYERMSPVFEDTLREFRDLAKALREITPDVREFVKTTREAMPDLRRAANEVEVTARNWGRLGERLDVLLQTNQDKLVKALDNINEAVSRVITVLGDENQRNFATIMRNTSAASKNLEKTVNRFGESIDKADQVLSNLQQATKPIAEHSESVMRNLDESSVRLNRTLTELNELLRLINQGDGFIRRVLSDPTLYNNLNAAADMLAHSMPRVDRILHDLEVFADKIARHPESLGIGGVVKPSAGLKDAPTNPHWHTPPGH